MLPVEAFLDLLRCPICGSPLALDDGTLACTASHAVSLIDGTIPDLAGIPRQGDSPGQWAMRFGPLVRIYERVWRPAFTAVAGGRDPDAETAALLDRLAVGAGATLLDVACGPGNTTRRLAAGVPAGRVLGADLSAPMLRQAAADAGGANGAAVAYVRADAHHLPLIDASVDGAHCAAALYLVSDPGAVIADIARVLRPGATFAGMTLVPPLSLPLPVTSRLTGLHYLTQAQVADLCAAAGLEGFDAERRGGALIFSAHRPPSAS